MKIGDYVRTKTGIFTKIKMIWTPEVEFPIVIKGKYLCDNNEIYTYPDNFKSSPNIINLIEENDIIKFWYEKERICHVYKVNNKLCVWDGFQDRPIEGITIISIVTKEQFESMEYKVKE